MMDSAPPPKFRLSLLGRFELTGPGGVVDLPSKKLAGLLAFLACSAPEPQPRERLTNLLWGSHFEAQARQNLRQALTRLRKVLGEDVLVSDGEKVALAPKIIVCDAVQFEAFVRDGGRDALGEALELYKGRLLADSSIPEEAWAEWVSAQRLRLESLALDAMIKIGEQGASVRQSRAGAWRRQPGNRDQQLAGGCAPAGHSRVGRQRTQSRRAQAL